MKFVREICRRGRARANSRRRSAHRSCRSRRAPIARARKGQSRSPLLRRLHVRRIDKAAGLAPPQRRVVAAMRDQFAMACLARRCGRGRAPPGDPSARWWRAGARSRSRSCPAISVPRLDWIAASTSLSSAEVASSNTRIGASLRMTRAIAMRWRWPPDKLDAALADMGVVAAPALPILEIEDEVVGMRELGRAHDLFVARLRPAIADIGADRAVQQRSVLRHHRDLRAQRFLGQARKCPGRRSGSRRLRDGRTAAAD